MGHRPVTGLLLAWLLAMAAVYLTPPPGATAAQALAGWPRLALYALSGTLLGLSVPALLRPSVPAVNCSPPPLRVRRAERGARLLVGLGVAGSICVAAVNVVRLSCDIADPLGPALWLVSMLLLLGWSLFPRVLRLGWTPAWPALSEAGAVRWRWLAPVLLVVILVLAAALRLPALADIPRGINADEGDRAATALDVLSGQGPEAWFDSGWFYINMVYFRVLAGSMFLFGPDIGGARMLGALTGIAFVAAVAWLGCRNFGWRVGLLATALAAGIGIILQHGRFISEAGPTALLWAISIGGFLEGARTGRIWAWALAGLSGGLSLYFYPSARLWVFGAVLTVVVLWWHQRDRRLWLGCYVAAIGALVAAAPFLVHLSAYPQETTNRYLQTTVLDPNNQSRLGYLTPPEPPPELFALQIERTLGMFDRYPDGGGFLPTGRPVFTPPLAALTLLGAVYALVRGWRDVRLAVLSVWFWLGLSGVAVTVETPDYLRSVGMLPALCFVIAVPLVDVLDRLLAAEREMQITTRQVLAGGLTTVFAVTLLAPEVAAYFDTFRSMPTAWGPSTREGQVVAALGAIGPVYSLEINEHLVGSGWVRLLAPHAQRGRLPNPGRELPVLKPVGASAQAGDVRPEFVSGNGQGLSVVLSPDGNQLPYVDLLTALYPRAIVSDAGDGRSAVQVSPVALAATRGVTLVTPAGSSNRAVDTFGQIPADLDLPTDLTWRAGIRIARAGIYRLAVASHGRAQVRLDGISVADGQVEPATPLVADVLAAPGLHFLELVANVSSPDQHISLTVGDSSADMRELTPSETYRQMDAPWGLLAHVGRRTVAVQTLPEPANSFLDATIAMAFFGPELGLVVAPNSITWTGALVAPRSGLYRMAFASEDVLQLEIDEQPVEVVSVRPEGWSTVGMGSVVQLVEGMHRVRVTLGITHGGRDLARWNWVPPRPNGAIDSATDWSVVPPYVLRPDPPVAVANR